jgi:hypothetical protein
MMRSYLKFGMIAAALISLSAMTASAGDLGLVENGDMELESRFAPHGTPGVDHPNGYADAWHHDATASWSDPNVPDPTTSGIHSLKLPDASPVGFSEMRSFAGDSTCCSPGGPGGPRTGTIPGIGDAGRILTVGWQWNWDITSDPNHVFTGTIRISDTVGAGLDLTGTITDHFFFTSGANSGGFQSFSTDIALSPTDSQFDIIFNTGNRTLDDADPGKFDVLGTLFVDDVFAELPEPASLLLLSISGLMVMTRRQRG